MDKKIFCFLIFLGLSEAGNGPFKSCFKTPAPTKILPPQEVKATATAEDLKLAATKASPTATTAPRTSTTAPTTSRTTTRTAPQTTSTTTPKTTSPTTSPTTYQTPQATPP